MSEEGVRLFTVKNLLLFDGVKCDPLRYCMHFIRKSPKIVIMVCHAITW